MCDWCDLVYQTDYSILVKLGQYTNSGRLACEMLRRLTLGLILSYSHRGLKFLSRIGPFSSGTHI